MISKSSVKIVLGHGTHASKLTFHRAKQFNEIVDDQNKGIIFLFQATIPTFKKLIKLFLKKSKSI